MGIVLIYAVGMRIWWPVHAAHYHERNWLKAAKSPTKINPTSYPAPERQHNISGKHTWLSLVGAFMLHLYIPKVHPFRPQGSQTVHVPAPVDVSASTTTHRVASVSSDVCQLWVLLSPRETWIRVRMFHSKASALMNYCLNDENQHSMVNESKYHQ